MAQAQAIIISSSPPAFQTQSDLPSAASIQKTSGSRAAQIPLGAASGFQSAHAFVRAAGLGDTLVDGHGFMAFAYHDPDKENRGRDRGETSVEEAGSGLGQEQGEAEVRVVGDTVKTPMPLKKTPGKPRSKVDGKPVGRSRAKKAIAGAGEEVGVAGDVASRVVPGRKRRKVLVKTVSASTDLIEGENGMSTLAEPAGAESKAFRLPGDLAKPSGCCEYEHILDLRGAPPAMNDDSSNTPHLKGVARTSETVKRSVPRDATAQVSSRSRASKTGPTTDVPQIIRKHVADQRPDSLVRSPSGEPLQKRPRIEITDPARSAPAAPPPKKSKAPKKALTITALAIGNATHQREPAPATTPAPDQVVSTTMAPDDAAGGKADPKRKRKAPAKKRKQKRDPPPALPSPKAALRGIDSQDVLFGTSSQLVGDESPGFLRDLQAALAASEAEWPGRARSRNAEPMGMHRNLWAVGARGEDGETMLSPESAEDRARFREMARVEDERFRREEGLDMPTVGQQGTQAIHSDGLVPETSAEGRRATVFPTIKQAPSVRVPRDDARVEVSVQDLAAPQLHDEEHFIDINDLHAPSPDERTDGGQEEVVSAAKGPTAQVEPNDAPADQEHARREREAASAKQERARPRPGGGGLRLVSSARPRAKLCFSSITRPKPGTVDPVGQNNAKFRLPRAGALDKTTVRPALSEVAVSGTGRGAARPADTAPPSAQAETPRDPRDQTARPPVDTSPEGWEHIDNIEDDDPPSPSPSRRSAPSPRAELPLAVDASKQARRRPKVQAPRPDGAQATSESIVPGQKREPDPGTLDAVRRAREELFPRLTAAVRGQQRSADPARPTWFERILMYDAVILEDLTRWFDAQGVRMHDVLADARRARGAVDGAAPSHALTPAVVQQWCEENSICAAWAESVWDKGRARKRQKRVEEEARRATKGRTAACSMV